MTDSSPTQIGSYRVLGLLGQNRWYESYLAAHLTSEHKVVIKLFTLTGLSNEIRGRFAWQLATLEKVDPNHPHLVELEYVGSYDNRPYLVLDYVPGGNLADLMHSQVLLQMPMAEVWYILKGLAEALDHLHEQGVIHGQVEPENILFDEEGEPRLSHIQLLNFPSRSAFASPEQRSGHQLNHQTDVYSLAAVAYLLLTNTPPAASNPKPIRGLRPDLPQAFDALFQQGLAQRAEERFTSAGAFVEALEEALSLSSRLQQWQSGVLSAGLRWLKNPTVQNLLFGFLFAFSVGLIILLAFFFNSFNEQRPQTAILTTSPTATRRVYSYATPIPVWTGNFYSPISNRPIEMIYISPGIFRGPDDQKINLDGFWIDAQEITYLEFLDYIKAVGKQQQNLNPNFVETISKISSSELQQPLTNITWTEARDYCLWRGGNLPSEYQWIKASYVSSLAENMFGGKAFWEWTTSPYLTNKNPSIKVAQGGGRLGQHRNELKDTTDTSIGFRCVNNHIDGTPPPYPTLTSAPKIAETSLPTAVPFPTRTLAPTPTFIPTPPLTNLPNLGATFSLPTGQGVPMIYIHGGPFFMGSEEFPDEQPVRTIFLDDYWIDQHEVTNAEFALFVADQKYITTGEKLGSGNTYLQDEHRWWYISGVDWQHPFGPDSSIVGLEQHPVVLVSWEDAQAYCSWRGGSLPTEEQWEKAARGTEQFIYPWGNPFNSIGANYCDKNCPFQWQDTLIDDGYTFTAPVGSYSPAGDSPYGVQDMAGNVWEWTFTTHIANPATQDNLPRIVRGGSWNDQSSYLRTANRGWLAYDKFFLDVGFRCVLPANYPPTPTPLPTPNP